MPEISRFYGIIIKMFFDEHPPKHFHAEYNEYKALIGLDNFEILEGSLPSKGHKLVKEWAELHKKELLDNWEKAVKKEPLNKIQGLE